MTRMHLLLSIVAGLLVVSAGTAGAAATYSGNLTYPGGIVGLDYWSGSVAWDVYDLGSGWWRYEYNLTTEVLPGGKSGGISHVVVEVTSGTTASDFSYLKWALVDQEQNTYDWVPWAADVTVGQQLIESGNPGMPDDMYGIRFLNSSPPGPSGTEWKWAIVTKHMPVWGDLYVKDGKVGPIYNNDGYDDDIANPAYEFTAANWADDPSAPAGNGSIHNNILRPDGIAPPDDDDDTETTPELSSLALLLLGTVPVGYAWRRRKNA